VYTIAQSELHDPDQKDGQLASKGKLALKNGSIPYNNAAVPGGLRLPLAGLAILPGAPGREREDRQGRVIAGCPGFSIGPEVTNQIHVVEHFVVSFCPVS
jgi:hypothetical protein